MHSLRDRLLGCQPGLQHALHSLLHTHSRGSQQTKQGETGEQKLTCSSHSLRQHVTNH